MKELEYPFNAEYILKKRRAIKRQLLDEKNASFRIKKKIAVLGGSTTHDIVSVLELFLLNYGIEAVFYESQYNSYYEDAVFSNETLDSFAPDVIYICTSNRNVDVYPCIGDSKETVDALLCKEFEKWEHIWTSLHNRFNIPIIQNNFELPSYRLLGNRDNTDYRGKVNFINRLNLMFSDYFQKNSFIHLLDINYLSSDYGLGRWSDPFYYYMFKYALAVPAIPYLSFNVANVIKAIFGKNKKGFVLDLDNTLWGGVIGDDGLNGISLGQETSEGQAYQDFQRYLMQIKDLGVVLNINSKNDEAVALTGLSHPDSILSKDDFIVIKANWNNKDQNFKDIADSLNLAPESLVFVDDNPAEREIVKQRFNEVSCPQVADVSNYIEIIDRSGFFENVGLSGEDIKRNEMYRSNLQRESEKAHFSDYGDYLDSLKMEAEIKPFEPIYFERISQLTNKSNQFNLTTLRLSENEIEKISSDPAYITLYGKLTDKFGDNGVVSLIIGKLEDKILDLNLWLMSCRVLKRDMEKAMFEVLVQMSLDKGITTIVGHYYKTPKNSMVSDFYGQMGFKKVSADDKGNSEWFFDVNSFCNENWNNHIKIKSICK